MRTITKLLGLGAVVVAGTLGWQALAETPAQAGPTGMGPMMMGMGHGPMSGHFGDPVAHLAALKTELGITAQQEPAWNAYAKTVQDTAASMKAQHPAMDMATLHSMSKQDRAAFISQMLDQHDEAFGTVKAAAETLLTALDDTQKAKAKDILPGLAAHGPGMMGPGAPQR